MLMLFPHVLTPEAYIPPFCTCICPMETTCKLLRLTPPPLKISTQPRRRRAPLCLLPCYFHSLSLALEKRIVNGNHMCIGCHTPTHACLWFITLHFLAHKAAQHLVVTSAPFWFEVPFLPRCLKAPRTKNDTGSKPAHTALEQGLSLAIRASGEQLSATCIYKTQHV